MRILCDSEIPGPQELSQSTFITSIWPVENFVIPGGQILINIERHKFRKSEISWRRPVVNFVHENKHVGAMW